MDFSSALLEIKNGGRLTRKIWGDDVYLMMDQMTHGVETYDIIIMTTSYEKELAWSPDIFSIMATDWERYEPITFRRKKPQQTSEIKNLFDHLRNAIKFRR